MTDDQKQIILGTLLGNGFICNSAKTPYLCIQHSSSYLTYFRTKVIHLDEYSRPHAWYQKGNIWGWRSRCLPIWLEFRKLCYQQDNTKMVSMAWLDQLKAIGIAVWYADSGCLIGHKKRNACLRTQSFGWDGNNIISRYFNEVGIPCHLNKSKNSHMIAFTVSGTKILYKLVAPYIHRSMYSKLINLDYIST